jgi:hypothetical protein
MNACLAIHPPMASSDALSSDLPMEAVGNFAPRVAFLQLFI